MLISEKLVYQAVYNRSLLMADDGTEYPACEISHHNGSKYRLEMAHIIPKSQGGLTTEANVKYLCWKCHRTNYHGEQVI